MAEVKQVSGSFSISSSTKKPPSFSNNGVSSSFKHIYDDVFTTSPSRKLQSTLSFMEDDYAEVFGCSKSNNGCWSIPYSSVPIIDLPKENGLCNRGERVDYGGVFGGIDSDSFGLPDGEELFDQLKKKAKTSSTHTLPRSQGLTMEAADPGISNQSYGQLPTNGFCQSFDKSKHFDSRNNEPAVNATSKSRNSAHFRANSLQEVSTAQKTSTSKDDGQSPANVFCQSSENMNHFQHRNNVTATNGPRKASHVRAYSLHEASGTQKTLSSGTPVIKDDGQSPTDGCCQFDNMKQFEPGNNDIAMNATNGFREATHVRAYSSHEASATQETLSSETPVVKDSVQSPANGFCQSFDNTKHFEFRNNNMAANGTSRPGKAAAHVRAYSLHEASTTQTTLSGQMPVRKDDTFKVDSSFGKKQGKHSKHISLDLGANKHNGNGDAGLQKVSGSGMSESNLVDSSPGTCQPSKAAMNEPCQSFDNTTHSKFKTNNMSNNRISGATHAAGIHPIHESNDTLHEIGSTQKTVSSRTSVRNDDVTLPGIDVNLAEEKEKHSHNTSSDLGADRQNDVSGAGFQKVSGLYESTSIDSSHEACQASSEAGPSKVVKDDAEITIGCNKVKKKGRRSRMASLDLSDCKDACEHDGGLQRKPRFGNSYSFDASHDPCAAHVKVQPSKMYPSSSLPQFFPVESHYKISENSSCKNLQKNMYEPLAEEFDVNSAAAVSAAALQRAIEEAEIRIRLAKEFLERERKGATKLRFKDTLKVKPTVAKENVVPNEINKFKQTNMGESFPPVDSEMQPFPPSDQKHDTTNAQVAAVFEDENKFVKDGEFAERKDATVSESVREEDKCEGGEWEAAKHLNQIISGVKNRIASFMSWQTETEKKEILKENEANISQQRPDEVENESKAREVFKERRTENNQGATRSTGEAMHEEERVQFAPEIAEPEPKESVRGFIVKPELGGKKVVLTPNSAEPSLGNFQFFAFRNQTVFEPLDSVEENKGHQENRMSETKNEEVQVTNEFKDEHLPFQSGEASPEQLNGKCVAHDSKTHDDVDIASDIGSSDAENNKAVEEPSSLAGLNETELSHERERQRDTNWKGSVCSINDEIAEMVEDLFSTVHDINEHTYEEDMQDDISRKSHKGFIMEENVEIAEEPYSLAGYDEKVLTDEEGRQDVMCRKSHLSSSDEEHDKIVEELYTQIGDGRINVAHEEDNGKYLNEEFGEESSDHSDYYESTTVKNDVDGECEVLKEAVNKCENVDIEEMDLGAESCESLEATEDEVGCQENERDEIKTSHIEETSGQTYKCEVIKPFRADDAVETEEKVTAQTSCVGSVEEGFKQNENLLSKPEQDSRFAESSSNVEDAVNPDDEIVNMIDITNTSEPEMDIDSSVSAERPSELIREDPVLSPLPTENIMEVDSNGIKEDLNDDIQNLQRENFISFDSETDTLGEKAVDLQSQDNLEDETDCWHESQENLHVEEFDTATDQDMETSGAEAVHRRRRWFDNRGTIATAERPSILEGSQTDLEIDQEILDESELAGSVEIHAGKLDSSAAEATSASEAEVSFNQDNGRTNNEVTPKRRRWFVKRGGEGVPEPLSLFEGVRVNLEAPLESTDENHETLVHKDTISGDCLDPLNTKSGESLNAVKTDVATNGEKGKQSGEAAPRRKRWFESRDRVGPGQQIGIDGDVGLAVEIDQESKAKGDAETHGKHGNIPILPEKDGVHNKVESKEHNSDMVEANRRGKEKEKEKLAVERAIREARERAFAEARERAKRDAAERPSAEARLRVSAGAEEKPCKVSSEGSSSSDKASAEAKLKAERAAVERATAEARERALQKALSDKSLNRSRENGGRYSNDRNSSLEPKHQSSRSSDASNNSEKYDGVDIESTQRRKARLERQKRTTERAAKALDEKNKRDLVAQEQAAKNMLADALDAEVRRWSAGKEGNLRALLSTLQYILGPDSGWQPVSLTDLVAATAVRKAYKKATLCVHPDKLQQRGASIQQKHICEKVFDLLKEAWGRFNPDER